MKIVHERNNLQIRKLEQIRVFREASFLLLWNVIEMLQLWVGVEQWIEAHCGAYNEAILPSVVGLLVQEKSGRMKN